MSITTIPRVPFGSSQNSEIQMNSLAPAQCKRKKIYKQKDPLAECVVNHGSKNVKVYHCAGKNSPKQAKYQMEFEERVHELGETWEEVSSGVNRIVGEGLLAISIRICIHKKFGIRLAREAEKELFQEYVRLLELEA